MFPGRPEGANDEFSDCWRGGGQSWGLSISADGKFGNVTDIRKTLGDGVITGPTLTTVNDFRAG